MWETATEVGGEALRHVVQNVANRPVDEYVPRLGEPDSATSSVLDVVGPSYNRT